MKPKIFYVDVETTGTDPEIHGIIQVGGIIEIDNVEQERIDLNVAPFADDAITDEALAVNKNTREQIAEFTPPREAQATLKHTLEKYVDKYDRADKFHIVGFNTSFDDDFLRAWFRKCGDTYYGSLIHWPPIDIAGVVAFRHMSTRHEFQNFKLATVAKKLGVELSDEDAHDAMADTIAARDIFKQLRE